MSTRAKTLVVLSVIAASLIGVTLWSALLQYKTYDDPRAELDSFYTDFGIGVEDEWARVYEPSLSMRFFRSNDNKVLVDVDFSLNSGVNADRGGTTKCYYFVPPGTEMVPRSDVVDGVTESRDTGDLRMYQKFDEYWVYEQTCTAPTPPDDEDTTKSSTAAARFEVSDNNFYQTRYREYQLEFDVAGLDGNFGLGGGDDPRLNELIKKAGVNVPKFVNIEVDSAGWNLVSHLPAGLDVDRETSSMIQFQGGAAGTGDDHFGGTPTFTISKPTGEISLGLIQIFATLFLGVAIDQIIKTARERDEPPASKKPVPPAKRTSPTKNKKKRK